MRMLAEEKGATKNLAEAADAASKLVEVEAPRLATAKTNAEEDVATLDGIIKNETEVAAKNLGEQDAMIESLSSTTHLRVWTVF